jgi:hypothetical protein
MRLIKLDFFLLQLIILTINSQIIHAAGITPPIPPSPATAIFVINNAGNQYDQFIPTIKDNLTSSLTQKGFSIVRTENAILPTGLPDSNENKVASPEAEASLNRLAEKLGARLLIVSTINSVTHDENTFDGTGTSYNVIKTTAIDNVRINLQIFDVGSTKSVYGDSVSTSLRTPVYGPSQSNSILINLFHDATVKIVDNITTKVDAINMNASKSSNKVSFSVAANIPSVDVFLDGMVIGSVGDKTSFDATPGIHQLKLGKEFLKSWEKTVNIIDGAKYSAQLELSPQGLSRYKDIEAFNLAMKTANTSLDVSKKQAETNINIQIKQSDSEIRRSDAGVDIAKNQSKANIDLSKEQMKIHANESEANIGLSKEQMKIQKNIAESNVDIAKEQSGADAKSKVEIAKGERVKRENSSVKDRE